MPSNQDPRLPVTIKYLHLDALPYRPALRNGYEFFRRHANGRYSDSTLVGISRAWDIVQENNDDSLLPIIVVAEQPFTYDPETEVKTGGILGMTIGWPEKMIMAVARGSRRQGIGTLMFNEMGRFHPNLTSWVGRANTIGHMFCLSRGMIPTAMNGQGAVRYTLGEVSDD